MRFTAWLCRVGANVCNGWKADIAISLAFQQQGVVFRRLAPALIYALSLSGCTGVGTLASTCNGPLAHWQTPRDGLPHLLPNQVALNGGGTLTWNDAPVTLEQLRSYLRLASALDPVPPLVLTVHPDADCRTAALVRQEIDAALDCRQRGLCGEA